MISVIQKYKEEENVVAKIARLIGLSGIYTKVAFRTGREGGEEVSFEGVHM